MDHTRCAQNNRARTCCNLARNTGPFPMSGFTYLMQFSTIMASCSEWTWFRTRPLASGLGDIHYWPLWLPRCSSNLCHCLSHRPTTINGRHIGYPHLSATLDWHFRSWLAIFATALDLTTYGHWPQCLGWSVVLGGKGNSTKNKKPH